MTASWMMVRRPAGSYQIVYWVILIILTGFSGLRLGVGCDWTGYAFQYLKQIGQSYQDALNSRDPAHWVLMEFIIDNGYNYIHLNIATSLIFFVGLHRFARRQTDPIAYLILAFPILIINMPMSAIRQASAIGFICIAFGAFIDRKLIRYVFWVLVASSFHSSAVIFLALSPFVISDYSRRNVLISMFLLIPGAISLLQTESADIATVRYIETDRDAAGALFRSGLLFLTSLIFYMFLRAPWKAKFPNDYKLANIGATMMLFLLPTVPFSNVIGDRFGYYLIPVQLMIFTRMPYLVSPSNRVVAQALPFVLLFSVFAVWSALSSHFQGCYIPYRRAPAWIVFS